MQQDNGVSVVKSQLQETGGSRQPSSQKSELEMTGSGELIRYEWNDGSGSLVVTPKDEFLLEKITASASSKTAEQPFLMPNTSADSGQQFFYPSRGAGLALSGKPTVSTEAVLMKCQQGPVEFGVLVPQDRTSMRVRMELVGREKVTIRGTERELLRLNLKGEAFSWALWVDDKDQFKLMRVLIADDNTEVVRD